MSSTTLILLAGLAGIASGLVLGLVLRARREQRNRAFRVERDRLYAGAERERQTIVLESEVAAREEALGMRSMVDEEFRLRLADLSEQETKLAGRAVLLEGEVQALAELRADLDQREGPLLESEKETKRVRSELGELSAEARKALEGRASTTTSVVKAALIEQAKEDARGRGAHWLRSVSEGGASSEVSRGAKRLMGIACGRLIDRSRPDRVLSTLAIPESRRKPNLLFSEEELQRLAVATSTQLSITPELDAVRIEGMDGVGKEVVRRCLYQFFKSAPGRTEDLEKIAKDQTLAVERETNDAGRRAFALLKIPMAHREIVALVGRLFYRTSYVQNQWEHAVEAGVLCGMMAAELGLDVKMARRGALMHDIGKALSHAMEGSHALIGADYARRLGEPEEVANAIGSHHLEEPFNSVYAHLVTAADAMSGGRPGARRQSDENHMAKLSEMERIALGFTGVDEAFAVQGGREVRVYVDALRVTDEGAGGLAGEIARAISAQLTFPGQIKITVIRQVSAVELAS